MNEYIKTRLAIQKEYPYDASEIDEKYRGGLWDWAGEIASLSLDETLSDELQSEIFYAMNEIFETLYKSEVKKDYSIDSNGYYMGDNLTPEQEIHNLNLDNQI